LVTDGTFSLSTALVPEIAATAVLTESLLDDWPRGADLVTTVTVAITTGNVHRL